MTKEDILAKVKRNELSTEEALVLLEKLNRINPRKPPTFKVAEKSGWCSIYFDGMWRPCTQPAKLWLELLEPENAERLKKFIEENKSRFRDKKA